MGNKDVIKIMDATVLPVKETITKNNLIEIIFDLFNHVANNPRHLYEDKEDLFSFYERESNSKYNYKLEISDAEREIIIDGFFGIRRILTQTSLRDKDGNALFSGYTMRMGGMGIPANLKTLNRSNISLMEQYGLKLP